MSECPSVIPFASPYRSAVRTICCETGFLGNPIDSVFQDRELFADFLTSYYTDQEPESSFLLMHGDRVRGYLLGCRNITSYSRFPFRIAPKIALRFLLSFPKYNPASRKFIAWILLRGGKEVPPAPKSTPHFHINLLPDARTIAGTRLLIDTFLDYLKRAGETAVYGQMVTFETRRSEKMFERYGFKLLNRSEITKYRHLHPTPVYLCTVLKNLEQNSRLYSVSTPSDK
jgi:hypothetical protein